MNTYKIRAIVEMIRRNGGLPTDEFGSILPPDELLVRYGLVELLSEEEQRVMKRELAALAEAQVVIEQMEAHMP
jgi:hypothetical protein